MTLTGLAYMVVFVLALLVALARYPIVGLFAYVVDFYVHPPSRWWGEFLPDLRWSLLTAGVTLLAILIRLPPETERQNWYATTPARIMMVFTAWFWVESAWAISPDQHREAAILLAKYIVIFWMVYRLIDTPSKVTAFLLAHLFGCFYLGFLAFQAGGSGRLDGVGGPGINDSNTLGMQLATGAVIGAMLVLHLRGWLRYLCGLAIVFALNGIVLTGSRGAFLALVAGALMLAFMRPRAYKRAFYVYAVVGVGLFAAVAPNTFWSRMDTVKAAVDESQTMDVSAESRIVMARAQLSMAALYPLGTGHRGSEVLSTQYLDSIYMSEGGARSSHNAFLTVLVEQGIPGVIISLILVGWVVASLARLRRQSAQFSDTLIGVHAGAIGGALAVVLVGGMFADFSKCEIQIWMFALLASISQRIMYRRAQATTPGNHGTMRSRAVEAPP